jgi:phosphate transport system protein
MTEPTGRDHGDAPAGVPGPASEPDQHAPLPTDLAVHPLAEIPKPFTRELLDTREQGIRDSLLRLGSMVSERTLAAVGALERHDAEAALAIIAGDAELNTQRLAIHTMVAGTIAAQQPVARDLRFLLAMDRVADDLERMGDHAASVAKQARKLAPNPPLRSQARLPELGRLVAQQVRDILEAVVDVNVVHARAVAARDDDVDMLYHAIFDETLELMRSDPANVDPGTRVLWAAHYLERTGDRVTNIAEDIVYLATGESLDLNP